MLYLNVQEKQNMLKVNKTQSSYLFSANTEMSVWWTVRILSKSDKHLNFIVMFVFLYIVTFHRILLQYYYYNLFIVIISWISEF